MHGETLKPVYMLCKTVF